MARPGSRQGKAGTEAISHDKGRRQAGRHGKAGTQAGNLRKGG
jgi:hypothetical protein